MKQISIIFTLFLTLTSFKAWADSGKCGDNLTWEYNNTTKILTISGTGEMYNYGTHYYINFGGGAFRDLSAPWFNNHQNISTIVINEGVTSIGDFAFEDCSRLTKVTIPNSVTTIGGWAFRFCSTLSSVTIPESVTQIGSCAFEQSGITSISIPNSVTSIEYETFYKCTRLISATIGNSVTSIGSSAFYGCSSLTSITIPDAVTSIEYSAFSGCSSLSTLTIGKNVTNIENNVFNNCNALKTLNYNATYCPNTTHISTSLIPPTWFPNSSLTNINIGNNVKLIPRSFAMNQKNLKKIIIPNSVTIIEALAFYECSGLTTVTMSNSVTTIGTEAFAHCDALVGITLPNSLKELKNYAFSGCTGLTSITIPNSVTSIDSEAFRDCSGLTSVTIGNSVTSIGSGAFYKCTGLTDVTFGNSLKAIGFGAFGDCNKIKSIYSHNSIPPTCDKKNVFNDDVYNSAIVYVPIENNAIDRYKSDEVWKSFLHFQEKDYSVKVSSITLDLTSANLNVGDNKQLNVTISPSNATNKNVVWSSSNTRVATVVNGLVSAHYPGNATITCTAQDGSNKSATCDITVFGQYDNISVMTSPAGYATFYSSETAYTLPTHLSAQVVTDCSNNKLTYKTIADGNTGGILPKGTAVMLVNDQKEAFYFTLTPCESTIQYTGINYLHGSDEPTITWATGDNNYYKLTYGDAGTEYSNIFGWYWGASNGAAFSIDKNKAWLALPSSIAKQRTFFIGDNTGVLDLNIDLEDKFNVYYDIMGNSIKTPNASGIYIKNGKKILVTK